MRIHHLNCISTCPVGGRLMDGRPGALLQRGHLCCHCILIEGDDGLTLIDTGFGTRDVAEPYNRLSRFFLAMLKPDFRLEMTAIRQIQRMGFEPRDVRHIVLTHLDFDHAGGLDDFPQATVHLLEAERDYAVAQKTWLDRQRFRPSQWSTRPNWHVYDANHGDTWYGFNRVQALDGVPPEIVMVPLLGHTFGHAGVAVESGNNWLFQTGDAYFFHGEVDPVRPRCTPGLRLYQTMMEKDRKARLWNQERLREIRKNHSSDIEMFCAHDVTEFERLSGRSARIPSERIFPTSLADMRTAIHRDDADDLRAG